MDSAPERNQPWPSTAAMTDAAMTDVFLALVGHSVEGIPIVCLFWAMSCYSCTRNKTADIFLALMQAQRIILVSDYWVVPVALRADPSESSRQEADILLREIHRIR